VRRCMALVPGSALQVDIFVVGTIPKVSEPMPTAGSSTEGASLEPGFPVYLASSEENSRRYESMSSFGDDRNSLLMPNPREGAQGRYGDGTYDQEAGLGGNGNFQEDTTYELPDYTRFDGDSDTEAIPGEELLSRRLRQEGALRRKMTRNVTMGHRTQDVSAVRAMLPETGKGAQGDEVALQFSDEELEYLLAITECAWSGRPILDKLIKEEVCQAKGPIVVACCGPTQLTATIRKIVAAQIDPAKLKAGDTTGHISCVTEEFEY